MKSSNRSCSVTVTDPQHDRENLNVTLRYTPFDDSYRPSYRQVSRVVQADRLLFTCGQLDTDGQDFQVQCITA